MAEHETNTNDHILSTNEIFDDDLCAYIKPERIFHNIHRNNANNKRFFFSLLFSAPLCERVDRRHICLLIAITIWWRVRSLVFMSTIQPRLDIQSLISYCIYIYIRNICDLWVKYKYCRMPNAAAHDCFRQRHNVLCTSVRRQHWLAFRTAFFVVFEFSPLLFSLLFFCIIADHFYYLYPFVQRIFYIIYLVRFNSIFLLVQSITIIFCFRNHLDVATGSGTFSFKLFICVACNRC